MKLRRTDRPGSPSSASSSGNNNAIDRADITS